MPRAGLQQDEEAVLGEGEGDTNWHAAEACAAASNSVSKTVRFNGENGAQSIKGSGSWSEEEEPETPKSGGFLKRETSTLFSWLGGHGSHGGEDEGYSTSSSTAEDTELLEEEEEVFREQVRALVQSCCLHPVCVSR